MSNPETKLSFQLLSYLTGMINTSTTCSACLQSFNSSIQASVLHALFHKQLQFGIFNRLITWHGCRVLITTQVWIIAGVWHRTHTTISQNLLLLICNSTAVMNIQLGRRARKYLLFLHCACLLSLHLMFCNVYTCRGKKLRSYLFVIDFHFTCIFFQLSSSSPTL